jgi:hypothetical protein
MKSNENIIVNRVMNGFVRAARAAGHTTIDEETIFAAREAARAAVTDPVYIARRRCIGNYPQTMGSHPAFFERFFALHSAIGADVFARVWI